MNYFLVLGFGQVTSDRQTDGQRCIRAHRAEAQVCSIKGPHVDSEVREFLTFSIWVVGAVGCLDTFGVLCPSRAQFLQEMRKRTLTHPD